MSKTYYLGDEEHIAGKDCWCEPEPVVIYGNDYWLHKDAEGETIVTDPDLVN